MKTAVNVLMGGPTAEFEVSIRSGVEVLRYIDKNAYSVRAVVIGKEGSLYFKEVTADDIPSFEVLADPKNASSLQGPFPLSSSETVWDKCQVAFLALHGSFGEDGSIQGYLESIGIPYTGSGVYASAVAMNKITSKYLYLHNGLQVPPFLVFGNRFPENSTGKIESTIGFPCYVKCPQSGSSRLMGRADTPETLTALLGEYRHVSPEILVEKSINGIEFTCGISEPAGGIPFPLPPIEIRPKKIFFDYEAKYTEGVSDEIVPAPRPSALLDEIQKTALAAHRILGCNGLSRTDMIYADSTLYVLETNTLPGLTSNSLFPKAYKAAGGTFPEMITTLIDHARMRGNTYGL